MPDPTREELRARLRAKVRSKREQRVEAPAGTTAVQQAEAEGAMLSLAGENPALLRLAQSALARPKEVAKLVHDLAARTPVVNAQKEIDSEEEEAPPL